MEKGEYEFSIRENVWDIAKTAVTNRENAKKLTLDEDIEFKTSYQTGKKYENIFQDVEWGAGEEKIEYLSRNDFAGTWKNTSEISRAAVADKFPGGTANQTAGRNFTFKDNQIEGTLREQGKANGLKFNDFKDASWDDPRWEDLLDQLTITDLQNLVDQGSFKTAKVDSISKDASTDYDGPGAAFHS